METEQFVQIPLWSTTSRMYQVQDQVKYAVEMANAAGLAAACSAPEDGRWGKVKIYLQVELDEVTLRLIQYLRTEGWERTNDGAEWVVALPPDLFPPKAFSPAAAYAHAFKEALRREMYPETLMFKIESKSRGC